MAECDRVQFRLAKARFGRLSELSGRYGDTKLARQENALVQGQRM